MKTRSLKIKISASLLAMTFLSLGFQNCSKKTNFEKDYSSTVFSASMGGDNIFYTNSKTVPVTVNLDSQTMNQIRASIYEDMDQKNIEWQPLNNGSVMLMVPLNEEYAADGSKDGPKDLYVEARDPATNVSKKVVLQAFLDTQTPTMEGLDLLVTGLLGKFFNKGEKVELKWVAQDTIAKSGMKSGIDPAKGFRWGVTDNGDCSESSLTQKSEWLSANDHFNVDWPSADPVTAFYFCLYVKDRAGNTTNLLSQPMTSLWSVLAGDNSQGNGSSVTSNKVRFKNPYFFTRDPQGNLNFIDKSFGTRRVIKAFENDISRTIEQAAFSFTQAVAYDSKGFAYSYKAGVLTQYAADYKTSKVIMTGGGATAKLAIRNYKGIERLLIAHGNGVTPYAAAMKSFLMEVPVSAIKNISTALTIDQMITQYKIAGNGIIPRTSDGYPAEVILTANDTVADRDHSLGYISDVAVSNSGDIFIATHADGAGYGYGNMTVRRLASQDNGSFKQTILSNSSWVIQMAYHEQQNSDGSKSEYLFLARSYGANVIDLKSGKVTNPFAELSSSNYLTAVAVMPSADRKSFEVYFGSSSASKIYRYGDDFKIIETLGRPIYDESITNALSSVLGNPDGLFSDHATGDIYLFDSQNSVIQKVEKNGSISKVAGSYTPSAGYIIGYRIRLAGDFDAAKNRKNLYYGNHIVDLNTNTVRSLYPTVVASASSDLTKYNWGVDTLAFVKGANDQNRLLIGRRWNVASNDAWHAEKTAFVEKMNLNGDTFLSHNSYLGDITKGSTDLSTNQMLNAGIMNNAEVVMGNALARKIAVDSQNNTFISGGKMLLGRVTDATSQVLSSLHISGAFVVLEEGVFRHIVFQSALGLAVVKLDLSKRGVASVDPVVTAAKKLCLPGTNLSGVSELIEDSEGNIVLSDANNARVLKYRVRASDGSLKFNYCQ